MAHISTPTPASVQAATELVGRRVLRAVDYLRVSTEEQKKGYGVASQGKKTGRYIEKKSWKHVGTYVDDGVSGSLEADQRDDLQRLMLDARAGLFDVVVVKEGRAIGRTGRAFWRWVWELEDLGIFVAIAEGDVDNTTKDGRSEMRRQADYAETEWETIRTRTQDGLQEKALDGGWVGGIPPFGYRIKDQGKKKRSRLAINESEAAVLRRAWELIVLERKNCRQAAQGLNQEGLHRRDGKPWRHWGLRKTMSSDAVADACSVFRNPARDEGGSYSKTKLNPDGSPMFGDTVVVPIPPIFDEDERRKLKLALDTGRRGQVSGKHTYPLSGRIFNSHGCGSRYNGSWRSESDARWYICSGKQEKYPGDKPCSCQHVDADALEARVWQEVCELFRSPEQLKSMAAEWLEISADQKSNHARRIKELDRQIEVQNKAIAVVIVMAAKEAVESGDEDPQPAIKEATKDLKRELAKLRTLRDDAVEWQAETESSEILARDLEDLAAMATKDLPNLPLEDQRRFLALWNVRVTITGPRQKTRRGRPCSLEKWFYQNDRLVPESVSDEVWEKIEPDLRGKSRTIPPRQLVEAILYKARTGMNWDALPAEFGHHSTIHSRCAHWINRGMWDRIMRHVPNEGVPAFKRVSLPPIRIEGEVDPRYCGGRKLTDQDPAAKTTRASR
ncbi:recombinase family protein [Streptomyces sp. B5E4]|uniref:recombinase family protein n=1 Tax=Streptomyces sp. B5E4 TaxID=3153568 RepID=UPI00325CE48A